MKDLCIIALVVLLVEFLFTLFLCTVIMLPFGATFYEILGVSVALQVFTLILIAIFDEEVEEAGEKNND